MTALNKAVTVTLGLVNGVVTATASIGPDETRGPAKWHIDTVIIQTNRPGVAPIPSAQLYQDTIAAGNSQGLTYDGSFGNGRGQLDLTRGQKLLCQWIGGQAGDLATLTVAGTAS